MLGAVSAAGGYGVEVDAGKALEFLLDAHDAGQWRAPYQVLLLPDPLAPTL